VGKALTQSGGGLKRAGKEKKTNETREATNFRARLETGEAD